METDLRVAASEGDCAAVERLIEDAKADINATDSRGLTVLHYVIIYYDHNSNTSSTEGGEESSPKYSKAEVVKFLCEHGANTNHESKKTASPFSLALERNERDCLKVLIDHGADVRPITGEVWTPLMFFVDCEDIAMVRQIIDQQELNKVDINGKNALIISCCNGNLELTKLLIDKNVKVDFVNYLGFSCLDYAEYFGHTQVFSFLEETTSLRADKLHASALDAMFGDLEQLEHIPSDIRQSFIKEKNRKGKFPLILAAMNGHLNVVKYLVEGCGCAINEQDKDGEAALISASKRSHSNVVEFLLKRDAIVTLEDKDSKTAFEYSLEKHNREAVDHFIKLTKDWKRETANAKNVLHFAAENCWISTLHLLARDAKKLPYKKDKEGDTALDLCRLDQDEYAKFKSLINPDSKVAV